MRRTTPILLTAALSMSMLAFAPAVETDETGDTTDTTETTETVEDEVVLPDPIDVEMFLHGADDTAYTDDANALGGAGKMDRTAPDGDFESKQILNYVVGPNPNCTGNGLLPTWEGFVGEGTIVGDATLTFDVVGSSAGQVQVEVWADQGEGSCNDAYVEPDVTTVVDLPAGAGTVEAAIDLDGMDPEFSILLVIKPVEAGPLSFQPQHQARMLFDGADYQASLAFTCQPDELAEGETVEDADCLPF